jgi:hypothetical protein
MRQLGLNPPPLIPYTPTKSSNEASATDELDRYLEPNNEEEKRLSSNKKVS